LLEATESEDKTEGGLLRLQPARLHLSSIFYQRDKTPSDKRTSCYGRVRVVTVPGEGCYVEFRLTVFTYRYSLDEIFKPMKCRAGEMTPKPRRLRVR
jgi:hypothetical protein